jgi:hypothetical protein
LIGVEPLLNALISVNIAQDGGAQRLTAAYRRISAVLIDFMTVREVYGSTRFSLDRAAVEIDAAIKHGRCGFTTKALFNELRERARLAVGRTAGATGDLDKLVQRIRGLREKTIEQGCTEQEAMAAPAWRCAGCSLFARRCCAGFRSGNGDISGGRILLRVFLRRSAVGNEFVSGGPCAWDHQ